MLAQLKQHDLLARLRINTVFWVPHGRTPPDRIAAANQQLAAFYQRAADRLPERSFLRYPPGTLKADPAHKWGPAPFHYDRQVYRHFLTTVQQQHAAGRVLSDQAAPDRSTCGELPAPDHPSRPSARGKTQPS